MTKQLLEMAGFQSKNLKQNGKESGAQNSERAEILKLESL